MALSTVAAWKIVAPLTGSVDRNTPAASLTIKRILVAPLTGSVDRNHLALTYDDAFLRRSPHGERG